MICDDSDANEVNGFTRLLVVADFFVSVAEVGVVAIAGTPAGVAGRVGSSPRSKLLNNQIAKNMI